MNVMATTGTATVTLPSDEEILITREFDAPKHLVYKAWTTPELVRQWWCGQRGEMTSAEIDLRVGGTWRYAMVATGGHEVAFHGEFREIIPNQRIVNTEVYESPEVDQDDPAINIVTFAEEGGRTTLTVLTQLSSKEIRDIIIESGMESGMQEGMDLLEQVAIALR